MTISMGSAIVLWSWLNHTAKKKERDISGGRDLLKMVTFYLFYSCEKGIYTGTDVWIRLNYNFYLTLLPYIRWSLRKYPSLHRFARLRNWIYNLWSSQEIFKHPRKWVALLMLLNWTLRRNSVWRPAEQSNPRVISILTTQLLKWWCEWRKLSSPTSVILLKKKIWSSNMNANSNTPFSRREISWSWNIFFNVGEKLMYELLKEYLIKMIWKINTNKLRM